MPRVDLLVQSPFDRTTRVKQLEAMFDVPPALVTQQEWHGELPIEDIPWNVGLIVGPSGCGKSTILKDLFGPPQEFRWKAASVIDDFGKAESMERITSVCSAVGLVESGVAKPEQIDRCMELGCNHPMGPLKLADYIGLDVVVSILDAIAAESGERQYEPRPLLQRMVHARMLGKKSGRGFLVYDDPTSVSATDFKYNPQLFCNAD